VDLRLGGVDQACSRCGTIAEGVDDGPPPGWSIVFENDGRITYQCPLCVRANIRAIEGKLSEEYWEF